MDIAGKTVVILVHNYFEQAEFEGPLQRLHDAGAEVRVVSASGERELQGLNHVDKGDKFTADLLLDDTKPDAYDALVLPGGAINADALRMIDGARDWVRHFVDTEKPLAAICHAPWVLVSAGCADGRHLTSFFTIQDDIRNAGGEWTDEEVVTDGRLITSRKPDDVPAFTDALIRLLAGETAA